MYPAAEQVWDFRCVARLYSAILFNNRYSTPHCFAAGYAIPFFDSHSFSEGCVQRRTSTAMALLNKVK